MTDGLAATVVLSGPRARSILGGLRARWPGAVLVASREEARQALADLPLPLVAKAEVGLAHRAVSGGVLRGLGDAATALAAVDYLLARFGGAVALVEEVSHDAEYVLGFQRNERYGPLIMFGLGGSDVGREVEFRAAPLSWAEAERLVAGHDTGAEGALVDALLSLQAIVLEDGSIASVDLNPVVVVDGKVVVLDAKVHSVELEPMGAT